MAGKKHMRRLKSFSVAVLAALLWVGIPTPAAALIFTVDPDGDGVYELGAGPAGEFAFSFTGSGGFTTSGVVRAVDILLSDSDIAFFVASGGTFAGKDVLVFDVVLTTNVIDAIGVSLQTIPAALDPNGAGYLSGSGVVPNEGGVPGPLAIVLNSGGGFFPGQYVFNYAKSEVHTGNLNAGETTRRLFLTYADTGTVSPLFIGATAIFMISSGINYQIPGGILIVPEPSTLSLFAGGLLAFAVWRRQRG